jgi:UPF0716 protein FxsA
MKMAFPLRLTIALYLIAEVTVFVLAVRWLGGGAVFLWVLVTAVLGVVLVRREGMRAIETVRIAMRERRAPQRAMPDRGLVATGGLLLILPGLLTDLAGVVLVVPATRPLARRLLAGIGTALIGRAAGSPRVYPPVSPGRPPASGRIVRGEVVESGDDPAD